MSEPSSFRLSQETYELLKKHRDFYDSQFQLQASGQSPLLPKATDPESRTEAKTLDNGDLEVSLVLAVDDDTQSENGRLYLRDRFVFDPLEKRLKYYQRSFEHNGLGGPEWQQRLSLHQGTIDPSVDITHPGVQAFAARVAGSFSRPIVDLNGNTLSNIKSALEREIDLLTSVNQQVRDINSSLSLKIKDKLNYYNIVRRDATLEVTLQLAIDDDSNEANGRIVMRDKFTLDAKTLAFQGVERSWAFAPGSAPEPRFLSALQALQWRAKPKPEEAERFIRALLPQILPEGVRKNDSPLALLSAGRKLPQGYLSPIARRSAASEKVLEEAAKLSLEAMYTVAIEEATQGSQPGTKSEDNLLWTRSLFRQVSKLSAQHPSASPFELMARADLTVEEKQVRERLMADPFLREINALAKESDPGLRHKSYASLAQSALRDQRDLPQSMTMLAALLQQHPETKQEGEALQALAMGNGSFGQKIELLLPRLSREIAQPSMLLGMAAAPLLGATAELGALKFAHRFLGADRIGHVARSSAAIFGITGEALGFSTIHRGLASLSGDRQDVWYGFGKEILSTQLMFGAMRLAHWTAGKNIERLAEGAWGARWGKRVGESVLPRPVISTPTGRLLIDEMSLTAQSGLPTLTRQGQILSGAMNHVSGILALQGSTSLSQILGLMPKKDQGFVENFLDAGILYGQALAGARLANAATRGALQRNLAEFKMGIENLKRGMPVPSPAELAADAVKAPEGPLPHAPLPMDAIHNIPHQELQRIWNLPMRALPREILASPEFRPIHRIRAGNQDFYLSKIIEAVRIREGVAEKRRYVLALVPVEVEGRTVLKRRFFYTSGSDAGAWRSSPYMVGDHHIAKGVGRHYTQETQPTWEISEALMRLEQQGPAPHEIPLPAFIRYISSSSEALGPQAQRTMLVGFQEEVDFPRAQGITHLQRMQPGKIFALPEGWGWGSIANIQETLRQMINMRWPAGFIPDFTQAPSRVMHQPNSLLGPLTFREYRGAHVVEESTGRRRPVVWVLGEDGQGRAWVRHLHYGDSAVNSYGVYADVLDSGILTSKPLEYSSQTGLLPELYRRPFNHEYSDISPALTLLEPIRRYRAARGMAPLLQAVDMPTMMASFNGTTPH